VFTTAHQCVCPESDECFCVFPLYRFKVHLISLV